MNCNNTFTRYFFLVFCFLVSTTIVAQSDWSALGADDYNQPYASGTEAPHIAIHPITGDIYMAFNIYGLPVSVGGGHVRKYNLITDSWENVGTSFSNGSTSLVQIAFNSVGTLYVGFVDYDYGSTTLVKTLNTDTGLWDTVGLPILADYAQSFVFKVGADDFPYVFYRDSAHNYKGTVKKFDGTLWSIVGSAGFTPISVASTAMAIAADGTIYVAFSSQLTGTPEASVMTYNGSTWQFAGLQIVSNNGVSPGISIAINPVTNYPLIAMTENFPRRVVVKEYNGTSWNLVGIENLTDDGRGNTLYVDSDGTPYVAHDHKYSDKAMVKKFNGTSWENIGTTEFSVGKIAVSTLAMKNNTLYIAYTDITNNSKPTLMKNVGDDWICLGGTEGFNKEIVEAQDMGGMKSADLTIAADGTIYYGYSEFSESGLITVRKYLADTNTWEVVGQSGISSNRSNYVSMATYQNTPYVAYSKYYTESNSKVTVKKFNGNEWVTVGLPNFSSGDTRHNKLAIAPDGTPYILFCDVANGAKATVMKFNGQAWVLVGTAGISEYEIHQTSIAIGPDGTPYVSYGIYSNMDGGHSYVKKFNGVTWENVGENFSEENGFFQSIKFGPDGLLYVVFSANTDGKANVRKFGNNGWEIVGTVGISPSSTIYNLISFKPDGQIFICFRNDIDGKPLVMKFNGADWVSVGTVDISASNMAEQLSFQLNPDGTKAIVVYASPCAYAKSIDITCNTSEPIAEDQSFCEGATVADLIAIGQNLKWFNVASFGTQLATDLPLTTGTYYVNQMMEDCEGPTKSVNVTVNSIPSPPTGEIVQILTSEASTISNLEVNGINIKWYDAAGVILPATTQLENGTTYYATQTINDCESMPLGVTVQFVLNTNQFKNPNFIFYPNPVSDDLFIESPTTIYQIEIFNIMGQKIRTDFFNNEKALINMSKLPTGIYLIQVYSDQGPEIFKVLKK